MNQIFNLQSYKFIDMCNSLGVIFLKFYSSIGSTWMTIWVLSP